MKITFLPNLRYQSLKPISYEYDIPEEYREEATEMAKARFKHEHANYRAYCDIAINIGEEYESATASR